MTKTKAMTAQALLSETHQARWRAWCHVTVAVNVLFWGVDEDLETIKLNKVISGFNKVKAAHRLSFVVHPRKTCE